jgi:L-ascorbate metabolism protein UlaG (beta-lactamase superfamily)
VWLKDDAFLADVRAVLSKSDALHLWWIGQSGFLLHYQGHLLLMDPYLSDSLTEKYRNTDKPHVRLSEQVIAPDRLDFIDVVTTSHTHTDHLDADTLKPLLRVNPGMQIVIPEANRAFVAERLGIDPARPIGLDDGTSCSAGGFRIHGVPAAHDTLETDKKGRHKFLGYVVEAGPWSVYHSGDTRYFPGMEDILSAFHLTLGLLPINGWAPERRVAGNLSIEEAIDVGVKAAIGLVVPHHFDMFAFNTADPLLFESQARARGLPVKVLRQGERLTIASIRPGEAAQCYLD